MNAPFTIILPHKRNPGNDAALSICLDCLFANTVNDFHLLMDAAYDQPLYPRVNRMMAQAQTECVVYWSSDMFAAPGWDVPMLELFTPQSFVTNMLVEPGVIGMHPDNIMRNFGRTPGSFDRVGFEAWCVGEATELNILPISKGWYAPVMYPREAFLAMGGLQESGLDGDHNGFTCADVVLFEQWEAAGNRIARARTSYTYHLQRWSELDEQVDPKRG